MNKNTVIIYTDGSSLGNPGSGGWGLVVLFPDGKVKELGAGAKNVTNNQMELLAAIEGLKLVEKSKPKAKNILIHTDSSYVLNGITMWIYAWVKNNWQTKTKEPVLNKELWEALYKVENNLKHKYEIEWIKVSGHAGVLLNERCDEIATGFASGARQILFTGNLKDYEKLFGGASVIMTPSQPSPLPKGRVRVGVSSRSKGKVAYSYVSLVGGKIHADQTWAECEKRVKGKSGAKYKKVFSKEEEQELIALWSLKSLI